MTGEPHYDEPGKNEERADRIDRALQEDFLEGPEDELRYLLADARHFCDRHGLDYGAIDRAAYAVYLADKTPGEPGSAEPVRPVAQRVSA